jgi:hypothetical protein
MAVIHASGGALRPRCQGCRRRLGRWYTDTWCTRCLPRLYARLAAVLVTRRPGMFGGDLTLRKVFCERRPQPRRRTAAGQAVWLSARAPVVDREGAA